MALTGTIRFNIFRNGKKMQNAIITKPRVYSPFATKFWVNDIIENSELKNQNSSMVANGRVMPKTNNRNSAMVNIFIIYITCDNLSR